MPKTTKPKTKSSDQTKKDKAKNKRPDLRATILRNRNGVIPWARRQFPTLRNEFQHFTDRVWNFAEDELFSGSMKPPVDVSETEKSVVISMDVPGFNPKDIDIQINENTITIRSTREAGCCIEDEKQIFHRTERPCGKFSRTLALPCDVGGNETAICENGVLTITIPNSSSATARKIKVKG